MSIGLEIINDNGSRQVVDTAPLLTFKDKLKYEYTSSGNRYFTADYLLAVKPDNNSSIVLTTIGTSSYSYKVVGTGDVIRYDYEVAPSGGDRFGLEVYNEQGTLQYSSNQKALKVLEVISISDIRTVSGNFNIGSVFWSKNYQGKELAMMTIRKPFRSASNSLRTLALTKSGYDYSLTIQQEASGDAWGTNVVSKYNLYCLILDVTGY